jgi:hypothetical protein
MTPCALLHTLHWLNSAPERLYIAKLDNIHVYSIEYGYYILIIAVLKGTS